MDITVIGAGMAGLAVIEKIKAKEPASRITLIDKNQYYFNRFDCLNKITEFKWKKISELAEYHRVNFTGAEVERINFKRKKIFLKDSNPIDFELLIIATGLKSKKISARGQHREGFFYLDRIDPFKIRDFIKVSNEAAVSVSTFLGLKLAFALKNRIKEVRVIAENLDFLGDEKDVVLGNLALRGIHAHINCSLEEVIGEGGVKAIKIEPFKVFSSQLVLIDSGFYPNRNFSDEELNKHDYLFTDYSGVYLIGDAARDNIENDYFFTSASGYIEMQADWLVKKIFKEETEPLKIEALTAEQKKNAIDELCKVNEVYEA
ncbi:MAG: FAD/NAD(P)-binding oxidoreductase [Candidatus Omnitrophota bacterium]